MIPICLFRVPSLDRWPGDLADLEGDIQRYLNDEPIEPRPRTWLTAAISPSTAPPMAMP